MKFTGKVKIMAAAAVVALSIAAASVILATEYGAEDPLISLSYLEEVFFPKVTEYVDNKVNNNVGVTQSSGGEYEVVTLQGGQTLLAKGSLELILRSGEVSVVAGGNTVNGIANLSSGNELFEGMNLTVNTYCLIPRGDGRGIVCTSPVAYVMVRGKYEIR